MKTERPQDAPGAAPSPGADSGANESASRAFQDAAARLAEVREYISFYIATKTDAIKLAVRNTVFYAVLGILALLAGAGLVVTAVVLFLNGLANAIGAALGGKIWAGDLIVGFGVLVVLALGAWFGGSAMTKASRRNTVKKYESRKRDQRARFGHDVGKHPDGN